jgi:hypothetical protein
MSLLCHHRSPTENSTIARRSLHRLIMTNRVGAPSFTQLVESYAAAARQYLLIVPANGTIVGAVAEIQVR